MFKWFAVLMLMISGVAQGALQGDLPLPYLEQSNPDSRNQPLVIFLHGSGSNEQDLFGIKDDLPGQYTYLSVQAPLAVEEDRYQWFRKKGDGAYDGESDDLDRSAGLIKAFVAQAVAKYHTEPGRVVLVGFSQGAIMAYEVALRQPEAVRGIAALSGKVLPVLRSQLKADPALESLGIFIGHGTADRVLPYSDGSEAESLLQGIGLTPEFHAYLGSGHTVSATEIQDLSAWLQQTLKP